MYSIRNRDDLERLKDLNETRSLLREERLKERHGKQDFYYNMEEVFKPVTAKQAEATEKKRNNYLKSKYKRFMILFKLLNIRQEQYNCLVIF